MGLAVYSILILDKKAVGVRMRDENNFYDVELAKLKGIKKSMLIGHKTQKLMEHGDLLVTKEELENNMQIVDMSEDLAFRNKTFARLYKSPGLKVG